MDFKSPAVAGSICDKVPTTAAPLWAKNKDKLWSYPPELTSPILLLFTCLELSKCSQLSVTSIYIPGHIYQAANMASYLQADHVRKELMTC
jgi:hypothetical protein